MALSVDSGTEVILESTSNGDSGVFYELCMDAIRKKNDFQFIFLPWFWQNEYASNDIDCWEISKNWLEYQKEYNISIEQLRWAYLKNQILCKISGKSRDDGPSVHFKREFPANFNEAFSTKNNDTLIPLTLISKLVINKNDIDKNNINGLSCPKINDFIKKRKLNDKAPLILGVDVARGGGDFSWIIDRKADLLGFNVNQKINLSDIMQVAYWVAKYIQLTDPNQVYIDAGGGGIAVVDRLFELGYKSIVKPINFAERSYNPDKFLNKRAEIWFHLKEFFIKGGYIIDDQQLLQQISSVRYQYNLKGQLQLEAKRFVKSNLKSSPDGADAAALTFAGAFSNKKIQVKANYDLEYNPFSW